MAKSNPNFCRFYREKGCKGLGKLVDQATDGGCPSFAVSMTPNGGLGFVSDHLRIHAFIRQGEDCKQILLVFVLMSGKEKRDYKKVFQKVKEMLQDHISSLTLMTACGAPSGRCSRNARGRGLQPAYYEKGGAYELMRKLMVLHFLPAQRINRAFEDLR
ncbi:hypothetical protein Bbelb_255670 [Branchiostoma belcheri]|nr:hypothetical protein Bbelb_255670 [Branchiostoma belcheri]